MNNHRLLAAVAVLCVSGTSLGAEPLSEQAILGRAVKENPSLKAALLQVKDASLAVAGESARYPWTLTIDAGATRTASPRIIAGANNVGELYGVDSTTQLQKRLRWGTDLSFSVRGAWQRTYTPTPSLSFIGIAPNGNVPTVALSARAGVTQPFLRGSGETVTLASLNVATAQRTQAERAAERLASALLRDVRTAYWDLWYAAETLRIQTRSRELAAEQRDQAAARANTGSLAPAEVLPFETRLATREEEVVAAGAEFERQQVVLAGRIGSLDRASHLGAPGEEGPDTPSQPGDALEEAALAASPEFGDLKASLEVARVQRRSAGDANRPRLDANAYVQLDGLGSADAGAAAEQLVTFGAVSAHAGLTFDAPLDPGRRNADIARANASIELAESRLEEKRQQVLSDLRSALAREAGARRRVELGEKTVRFAKQQLEAEKGRFLTGSSTAIQVLQAEDDVRNATLRVARAKVDSLQQSIVREHLTGQLLGRHAALVDARLEPLTSRSKGVFENAAY